MQGVGMTYFYPARARRNVVPAPRVGDPTCGAPPAARLR